MQDRSTTVSRVILLGATGFTGRLTAAALVRQEVEDVILAGRDRQRLSMVAGELNNDLRTAVVDVMDPATLAAVLEPGDVLISTVGPFTRYGDAVVAAAANSGARYLDSCGEPPFIRRVFEHHDRSARDHAATLIPAFGYDFVPGCLAGALALQDAGDRATGVEIGYFLAPDTGTPPALPRAKGASLLRMTTGGTRASLLGMLFEPAFRLADGRIIECRSARSVRRFDAGGLTRSAINIGGAEHFTLPQSYPRLRSVETYLGWFDSASPAIRVAAAAGAPLVGRRAAIDSVARLAAHLPGANRNPTRATRAKGRSLVVATARDETGRELARAELQGPEPYTLTADLLAWGARELAIGTPKLGALGPLEAFGLEALERGCATFGLVRVP